MVKSSHSCASSSPIYIHTYIHLYINPSCMAHCCCCVAFCRLPFVATGGSDLARRLIEIYFTLFKLILEGQVGRAAATAKEEEAKKAIKGKDRHRDRSVLTSTLLCQTDWLLVTFPSLSSNILLPQSHFPCHCGVGPFPTPYQNSKAQAIGRGHIS